jgi:probable phosphoglycerate mutase
MNEQAPPRVELWLIRHGETTWNEEGLISGWSDPPLTEQGREQARALRAVFQGGAYAGVWSSDLQRAVQTAELAWGQPTQDPRIRELNFGDLEAQNWLTMDDGWKVALLNFEGFQAPGGEHVDDFRSRVFAFFDTLGAGIHLIFVHGGLIRMVLREVDEDKFLPSASIVKFDWTSRNLLSVMEGGASQAG